MSRVGHCSDLFLPWPFWHARGLVGSLLVNAYPPFPPKKAETILHPSKYSGKCKHEQSWREVRHI
eukprot:1521398-Amphidinium_carterae.1